jgi:7 transmembrane receptor (rhodopsin family)
MEAVRDNRSYQYGMFAIGVICALGSAIVLLALYRSRPLTPHLILVASLCFVDLLLGIEVCLYATAFNNNTNLIVACQINSFFSTFGEISSIFCFGMITLERYLVICRGLQDHVRKTIIAILITYIYTGLFGALSFRSASDVQLAMGILCHVKFCSRDPVMLFFFATTIILITIIFVILVYCPYKILQIYAVTKKEKLDSLQLAENSDSIVQKKVKERAVFIKLSIITVVFILMIGPISFAILSELITGVESSPNYTLFYVFTSASNSALNPILLYLFDVTVHVRVNDLFGIARKQTSSQMQSVVGRRLLLDMPVVANKPIYKDTVKLL